MTGYVCDSVNQINQNPWLIGDKFILNRQRSPPAEYLCEDAWFCIMVDSGSVGLIDWEVSGYVPREWIRTEFGVRWGMEFTWLKVAWDDQSLNDWRFMVERRFGEEGYPEVKQVWVKWFKDTNP
ncbi:hypothetical protein PspLS_01814 [Pyricularia sp. CBS 133598]|nr:hypothetical protein PspLS_01814 [Pyricularia sp. CBS 133598]